MAQAIRKGMTRVSMNIGGTDIPLVEVEDQVIENFIQAKDNIQLSLERIRKEINSPEVRKSIKALVPVFALLIGGKIIHNGISNRHR